MFFLVLDAGSVDGMFRSERTSDPLSVGNHPILSFTGLGTEQSQFGMKDVCD